MKRYYVYILASKRNGTLYIGVTSNLSERVMQHKEKRYSSFTAKYNVDKLVYYQEFSDIREALLAEKRMKKWNREWKLNMIEKVNPDWVDLSGSLG